MDLENKPNMGRTRIGGAYMVVYGSGDGIWQRWWYMAAVVVNGSSDGIWQRWWYMAAVVVYGSGGRMVMQRREKL